MCLDHHGVTQGGWQRT